MTDRPSRSSNWMIPVLGVCLLAAIAVVVWLAMRPDTAPPATTKSTPVARPRADEHPAAPHAPRPKEDEPLTFQPKPQTRPPVDVGADEAPDVDMVKLDVEVFGSNGVDAPAALVSLLDPFAQHVAGRGRVEIARGKTDESGHAKFELVSRFVRVYAWRDSEAGVSDKIQVTPAKRQIAVRLATGVVAHGRVVETGGSPVADAEVRFRMPRWYDDPFGLVLETKSASDGTFALPPIPLSAFDVEQNGAAIEARAKAWPMSRVEVTADTLRAGEVVVTLERGAFLRGRVVKTDGRPIPSKEVRLADGRATVLSEPDGRFELPLPRDGGTVLALAVHGPRVGTDVPVVGPLVGGAAKLVGRFRGDRGDIDVGDVVISAGQSVKGVVVYADEKPVQAGDVTLYLADVQVAATQTDDAGKFEFDAVGDDAHAIVATEAPGENAWSGRRHASAPDVRGGATDVRIRVTGALTVLVSFKMEADRSPIVVPQASVRAVGTGDASKGYGWSWAGAGIRMVRFEVERAGTYDVTVELPGYEPATAHGIEVSPDREMPIDVLFRKAP